MSRAFLGMAPLKPFQHLFCSLALCLVSSLVSDVIHCFLASNNSNNVLLGTHFHRSFCLLSMLAFATATLHRCPVRQLVYRKRFTEYSCRLNHMCSMIHAVQCLLLTEPHLGSCWRHAKWMITSSTFSSHWLVISVYRSVVCPLHW